MKLKNNFHKFTYIALAVLVTVLSFYPMAIAQAVNAPDGLNIEISPLPIELSAKPGTTASTDLRIRNTGSSSENLKITLKTFTADGPTGQITLHDPTPTDSYVKWVSFDKPVFTAPPGQWQTIKMNIAVPPTAAFGYYYAVQFELANPPKPQPGAARLQGAVAIFVLLDAQSKNAVRKLDITGFKADHSSYEFLPANFTIQIHNSGNVHTAPQGNIFIKRGSHQVAILSISPAAGMVLPKSNRLFTSSWNDGFPVYVTKTDPNGIALKSDGRLQIQLKWDFSKAAKLRFGHYTANLVLIYNDGTRDVPITASLSFWVIPWRLIAIILVILALIGGLGTYVIILRRRLKRGGHTYRNVR